MYEKLLSQALIDFLIDIEIAKNSDFFRLSFQKVCEGDLIARKPAL